MSWPLSDLAPAGRVPVVLAPMAGVNDVMYRSICVEMGADLTFTEMVSSKALSFANEKTRRLLDTAPNELHVGVQLFGHEPDTMAREAAWVEDSLGEKLVCIDVNMGCPARKIIKKGDGSALLNTPDVAQQIVRQIKSQVSCPVTVKFRKGFAAGEDVACDFAKRMEDAGADWMTVHGRTTAQMYSGDADWDVLGRVKRSVSVPVIGNGDIKRGEDARAMVDATGVDGVMIARGAQGNPWIFPEAAAALAGEPAPAEPTDEERVAMARRHASMLDGYMGNTIVYMRKHVMWYLRGVPGVREARGALNSCVTMDDFNRVLDKILVDAADVRAREAAYRAAPGR
ncbi:tRNA dihydrouridine synthase DusB [Slackia heliotrinireducens]|uniref:tRNA-dihydrouridine synthase n=1 Tax=Slackia heliotrinireducens (strain ATCC 29202 / DSM 20476 / NCTC 11029 / RHS 1) TaxID=471855 RepID=C7N581_SLAHD|nr:tRNA dihydrouridine synthase DusB [Slackia heliotrinireducens]ACV22066.1 putative TIM-barrel protein, nifR3 family [Slackia heliotrinireducens DSM 20476]VEH00036.1 Probable tRNA-dihydrouridine synthase [Slackia heliotrinireducens]